MNPPTLATVPYVIPVKISRFEFVASLGMDALEFGALNPHLLEFDVFEEGVPLNIPKVSADRLPASRELCTGKGELLLPLDWAIEEFRSGIQDYAGPIANNPRIKAYQQSTTGVGPDDVPWASSFVNWCVLKAGLQGTNNNAACSWHQWREESKNPTRGDVAVFKRKDLSWKGYVGFFWSDAGTYINLLCASHQNGVGILALPKNGSVYQLLSIRKVD